MKYRLVSIALVMSFCLPEVGNASALDATLVGVLHSWLPNMDNEVFDAAMANLLSDDPETPHFSDDDIIEAVAAQIHYQKKLCWFYPRVSCKNGDNCKFRHEERDLERLRKQNLEKCKEKKKKKEKKPFKIELKEETQQEKVADAQELGPEGGESGSGIEIVVTENGQLLESTISQRGYANKKGERQRQNWQEKERSKSDAKLAIVVTEKKGQPIATHNQNLCVKKRKPRHQQQPLVINTLPVITPWAQIISPNGWVFNVYYSYHPNTGTHLICHDARFIDYVRSITPEHIVRNNWCYFEDQFRTVVEIGGAAAHHVISVISSGF